MTFSLASAKWSIVLAARPPRPAPEMPDFASIMMSSATSPSRTAGASASSDASG